MIAVIGATGNVGTSIVRTLAAAGEDVVAFSRRGGTNSPRVRHVVGDLAQPAALRDHVRGASAAFVMVAGSGQGLDFSAIADVVAEAKRIVALSSIGARSRPTALSHEPLRQLEAAVKATGRPWTILQPGGFDSNALFWMESIRGQRAVVAPFGDVAIPLVDPDDIGQVAAAALRDESHAGKTYELTGPAAITPRAQTEALSAAIGIPLSFRELTRSQAVEAWSKFMPPLIVETTLDAIGMPNEIELRVSADIERVLGRPAQSFADWATRTAAMFR